MSISKTEKCKYKSPSTDEFCTAQQYVTELVMTREAKKKFKSLPLKFWNIDEYKKQYKLTLFRANALVKAYSEDALVRAICNNSWLYSLFFPRMSDLLEVEEKFLISQVAQVTKIEVPQVFEEDVTSFRQVVRSNNNTKSKLDE